MNKVKLTILMPCLNEAETLAKCINKAKKWAIKNNYPTEILIADNGSKDESKAIAKSLGANVVEVESRGYGNALYYGALEAKGKYIIMGDADDSYDFSKLDSFVKKLEDGFDLVVGNRFAGGISEGAMPWKNKYIGNPILSWLGRLFFKSKIRDFHCGLRGVSKNAFLRMDLRTSGMEFASEMIIKASIFDMKIEEVATTLSKDGRSRPPHLKPWRDGWRHLRFMLLFCPRWLFVIPGLFFLLLGAIIYFPLLLGPLKIKSVNLDIHTLFYAEAIIILGLLSLCSGTVIRVVAAKDGLMNEHRLLKFIYEMPLLELGSFFGLTTIGIGVLWSLNSFGNLAYGQFLRIVSLSSLTFIAGGIIFLFSLILGFLKLPTRNKS
jgi:glycosyltransferase involved in cell wall biosynthesis